MFIKCMRKCFLGSDNSQYAHCRTSGPRAFYYFKTYFLLPSHGGVRSRKKGVQTLGTGVTHWKVAMLARRRHGAHQNASPHGRLWHLLSSGLEKYTRRC